MKERPLKSNEVGCTKNISQNGVRPAGQPCGLFVITIWLSNTIIYYNSNQNHML